jgi:DNA-binding LacI/PurR family transcriptional regulator
MEDDEYHLLLLFRSAQDRFMNLVNQGRIDGMFVLQSDLETAHIETVVRAGLPTVVVNKHYDVPTGSGAASVHSDHNGLMREILAEFVSAGSRTLLAFHDYRFCDANTRMQNALLSAVSELADAGIVVSTVIPDHAGLSRQVGNMFGSGQRWDGIFVDGAAVADTVIEEARRHGLEAGTDYELIVAETQPGRTTGSRAERCVYCHQPEEVGRAAWDVMRQLLHGGAVPALVRVPYTRLSVRCAAAHSDTVSNAIQTGGMQPPAEEKPACET